MKEIGEQLKETRENMGISIEEVSEDLKVTSTQIEDIEKGNMKAFKDIYSLKFFIRDYSKYLGLDYDSMIDDFNEYLFDYTSKLSIDEIRKASEDDKKNKLKEDKISSPYTTLKNRRKLIPPVLIWVLVILIIACASFIAYKVIFPEPNTSNVIE